MIAKAKERQFQVVPREGASHLPGALALGIPRFKSCPVRGHPGNCLQFFQHLAAFQVVPREGASVEDDVEEGMEYEFQVVPREGASGVVRACGHADGVSSRAP